MISVETTLQILESVPRRHARYLLEQAVFHPRRWKDIARLCVAELDRQAAKVAPVTTPAPVDWSDHRAAEEAIRVIDLDMAIAAETPEYVERGEDVGGQAARETTGGAA